MWKTRHPVLKSSLGWFEERLSLVGCFDYHGSKLIKIKNALERMRSRFSSTTRPTVVRLWTRTNSFSPWQGTSQIVPCSRSQRLDPHLVRRWGERAALATSRTRGDHKRTPNIPWPLRTRSALPHGGECREENFAWSTVKCKKNCCRTFQRTVRTWPTFQWCTTLLCWMAMTSEPFKTELRSSQRTISEVPGSQQSLRMTTSPSWKWNRASKWWARTSQAAVLTST